MHPDDLDDHVPARPTPDGAWEPARMAAAAEVQRLRNIQIPVSFASRLERQVRARSRELCEDGATESLPSLAAHTARQTRLPQRRMVIAVGSAITAMLVAVIFLAVASVNSVPGDWLYGIKQFGNQIALANASGPAAKAQVAVQQLQAALTDLRTEVANQRPDADVQQAIAVVVADTQNAQSATDAVPAGSDYATSQSALANVLSDERATLHSILSQRDWSLRLICTQQLGTLGETIPAITNVQVIPVSEDSSRLIITGTNFAAGARVYIDGRLLPAMPTGTATTLTVIAGGFESDDPVHAVGVQNPDGTAADLTVHFSAPANQGTPEPDDGGHGTPGPGE